jgi:ABC-type uncharacterized transport system ATPase subunit
MGSTSQIAGSENGSRGRLPVSSAVACAISVRGLAKTYRGGVEAVKGIDFEVTPGEVFGLLGPNGAGKSTTIGMLTTTIAPTAGREQPSRPQVRPGACQPPQKDPRRRRHARAATRSVSGRAPGG